MRDAKGRYVRGFCGNLKGRPVRKPKYLHDVEYRNEFFEATEEILSVNINGKAERKTAMNLIHKQLIRKAAGGDVRCMIKVLEKRDQYAAEAIEERLKILEEYLKADQAYRENPDDAPQRMVDAINDLRQMLRDWLH